MSHCSAATLCAPPDSGWKAELALGFRAVDGRTRLVERRHRGPLVVQRPFYPEGEPCHVYVVHPPGGVVGGDDLRIDVRVEPGAHALLTTPAATKFYRCAGRVSSQTQLLEAGGATLEWLPQENIFYRGADVRAATRVHLDAGSRFIGWEIACFGLPARGERFDAGRLALDVELWRGMPVWMDRLRLRGDSAQAHEAVGTLLATPAAEAEVSRLRPLVAAWPFAAVTLVDGVLLLRALASQAEAVRGLFIDAWRELRPSIIGRAAVCPRIWST